MAISADTLVVGAAAEASSASGVNGDETDNSAVQRGAAYAFARTAGTWAQQAYLKPTGGPTVGNSFGSSVAVVGDLAWIGAPWEGNNAGAAYLFARTGSRWAAVGPRRRRRHWLGPARQQRRIEWQDPRRCSTQRRE